MRIKLFRRTVGCLMILAAPHVSLSQQDFSQVQIKTEKVAGNIFMLSGGGGNIGVAVNEHGILLIDSMFGELHEKIRAALGSIGDAPVVYLINTHGHYDHVGGNARFGASGVDIVAHENVRRQMEGEWSHPMFPTKIPPYPESARPRLTYAKSMTLHFGGDEVDLLHMAGAHADGDTVVVFRKANVIHMGDLYFAQAYPFIDVPHGGSVDGIIEAMDRVLKMSDENTRIIPGHGPLSNPTELKEHRNMLSAVRGRIADLIDAGRTEAEVVAAKPLAEYEGRFTGAFPADVFVQILYQDLSRK